ncbi:MAG: FAD-dependent oxidoreductase [Xanthobacteraceae bacterium]|nr:FAD-dependent oxidoreductase [Xanthobacteraceae bacterium]QYK46176.1 MAG: FAD-dependent oxidoreductase [Xanthobacteraceae bacterium]
MTYARRRAVVVGGSLAGLFAGLFLRRTGWDVTVHERVGSELGSRGAGIVTHDDLHQKIALATGDDGAPGVPVRGRVVLDKSGSVVCESEHPQRLASWDRLWRLLRKSAGSMYRQGSAFESLKQDNDSVVVNFSGGSVLRADLLICADGIRSTARRILMPDAVPQYAGYVAWRGLVPETLLSKETRAALMDRFGFCLPPGEQMLGYPVDGADDDVKRYNYVWYRPADRERDLPRLFQGRDGKFHGDAIAPDLLLPEVLDEMRSAAERTLAPAFAEIVRQTPQPLLQAISDLEVPQMVCGRAVLIGDAAFVARPHVGMGVTKAAADAWALASALETEPAIDTALAKFNAERVALGSRIIRRARHLGAYMQSQLLSDAERHLAEKHRSPQAVMKETASMAGMENW